MGQLVNDDRFAYTVAVLDGNEKLCCAGAILNPIAVLSTALCLTNVVTNYKVLAGAREINRDGKLYPVERIIKQEGANFSLAILALKERITGNSLSILTKEKTGLGVKTIGLGWGSMDVSAFTYLFWKKKLKSLQVPFDI